MRSGFWFVVAAFRPRRRYSFVIAAFRPRRRYYKRAVSLVTHPLREMSQIATIILRQALAGAAGGLLTFALTEPMVMAGELRQRAMAGEPGQQPSPADLQTLLGDLARVLTVGSALGALISATLTFAEQLGSGRPARIFGRTGLALLIGGVIGVVAIFMGAFLFGCLASLLSVVIGRALGWALLGAGLGVAGGAVTLSGRKTLQGLAGGGIGGFIGGLLFDLIGNFSPSGHATASRLVGFTIMGVAIGVAIALAEEIAKRAWVTVLTGRGEGTRYLLNKPQFTIGRAELADIPLFGDASIDRTQAVVADTGDGYSIQEVGPAGVLRVNGQPAAGLGGRILLLDGTLIELGRHRLRFCLRAGQGVDVRGAPASAGPGSVDEGPVGFATSTPPHVHTSTHPHLHTPPSPTGRIRLRAESGPHLSAVFDIPPGGGRIGRTPENAVCLGMDAMISRQHAEIFPEGEGWVIRDLGSRNGVVLNGERVPEAWINPGDRLQLGAGVYLVENATS